MVTVVTGSPFGARVARHVLAGRPQLAAGDPRLATLYRVGVGRTAVPNMVTAVLADYRGFDTLGEVTVIFTGAMAVLLILRVTRDEDEDET